MKFLLVAPLFLAMCSSTVIAQAMLKKEPTPTPQARAATSQATAAPAASAKQASPSSAEADAQHRDMWQVVDEVSTKALAGAPNTTRHRSQAHADAPLEPALLPAAVPEAGELRTGCGGGITGGASGLALTRDGHLSNWRHERAGPTRPIRSLAIGTDAEAAVRLFERAIAGGFNTLVFHEAGNRTCWVELTMSGATHGVYWVEPQRAPALAVELHEALDALRRGMSVNSASPAAPTPAKKPNKVSPGSGSDPP